MGVAGHHLHMLSVLLSDLTVCIHMCIMTGSSCER